MSKLLCDMSISEVMVTPTFQTLLEKELVMYNNEIRKAGARSDNGLKKSPLINLNARGDLERERFSFLYAQCLDKVCELPASERKVIIEIGNTVFYKAMTKLQEDEEARNNADRTDNQ